MASGPGLKVSGTLCAGRGAEFPELLLKSKSSGSAKQLSIFFNMAQISPIQGPFRGNEILHSKTPIYHVSRVLGQTLSVSRSKVDSFLFYPEGLSLAGPRAWRCLKMQQTAIGAAATRPKRSSECVMARRGRRLPPDRRQCRCSLLRAARCKGPVAMSWRCQIPMGWPVPAPRRSVPPLEPGCPASCHSR